MTQTNVITSYQILQRLIKNGCNPTEAKIKVKKHYDYAIRCYKDATVKQLADIIATISIND